MVRPIAAQESLVDLVFPVGGLDLSQAYSLQRPGTTPTGQNVRAFDALAQRQRGGQRPGLAKYAPNPIPGATLIQDLACVVGTGYSAPAPSSGPYPVQTGAGATGTGTSQTDTFPSPVTTGNAVLVCTGSLDGGKAFPTAVSDGTNTYTRLTTSSVSASACSTWLATNVSGAITAVTATWASGTNPTFLFVIELAGIPTSSAADVSQSPTGANTFGNGTNLTTTHAPDIIFGLVVANFTVTRTDGNYSDLLDGGRFLVAFKYAPSIVTTGADLTFTLGGFSFWAGIIQAIKGS